MSEAPFDFCDARSASRTLLAARFTWRGGDEATGSLTPAALVREVVVAHGGRIATLSDEALLAEMTSPTDTLQCAAALQDRFALERARLGPGATLRAAVAAGEVTRHGRELIGEPVDLVNRLAERAAPGEVLFSQSVRLSMTRSEISFERFADADSSLGQPIHRLVQPPGAANPELPFGGMGLRRSRARLRVRSRRRGRARPALLLRRTMRSLAALPRRARGWGAPLLTSMLVAGFTVAGVIGILPVRPSHAIGKEIAEGRPREALRLAERWVSESPDAEARAWRGAALAAVDRVEEAREALAAALAESPRLAHSPAIARGVVRTLDRKGADRSVVMANHTPAIERALLEAASSERYWLRWNAIAALEKLGLGDRVDRVQALSLDLRLAGSCGIRVRAARELAKLGDPRAVPALEEAKEKGFPGAACNLKRVAEEALASLPRHRG
ncbi:MAG TPA: hypothetical protein VN033_11540 [Vulgatibacter sp.]|nr:hypothetical protein [Vulgatibacter sp.]